MEISIEIDGLKEMEKALRKLGADLGAKTLKSALMAASKPMLDDMKEAVPVGRGDLKGTLGRRSKIDRKGSAIAPVVVSVGAVKRKGAWKAKFQEFGTSKQSPRPFIQPAFNRASESVQIFSRTLAKRILAAQKKLKR